MDIQNTYIAKQESCFQLQVLVLAYQKSKLVIITSEPKSNFIRVQNEYISIILNSENWDKAEQLLIYEDDKKYDKITIHQFFNDGDVIERVFWFDITECFEKY